MLVGIDNFYVNVDNRGLTYLLNPDIVFTIQTKLADDILMSSFHFMTTHYLTASGLKKLEEELNELKERQKKVSDRIEEAIKMGDLSENAEYSDAKDEQAFVAGRIAEVKEILKNAEIIDEKSGKDGVVSIGCTVEVKAGSKTMKFTIVGAEESNPSEGMISHESPLGKAFLEHKKGDKVEVSTPGGTTVYTIEKVC